MGNFVRTGASSIQGQGLFATRPFSTADVILTLDTSRVVDEERPLRAGEEVTIDYLINTHGGSSWRCRCGADRCRGELETSFFELPLPFQREYLPLLEDWFVAEHRECVEELRRGIEEEVDEGS